MLWIESKLFSIDEAALYSSFLLRIGFFKVLTLILSCFGYSQTTKSVMLLPTLTTGF